MEKVLKTYRYRFLVKRDRLSILFACAGVFIGQVVLFSFANPFFGPFLALFLGENIFVFSIAFFMVMFGVTLSFNGVVFYSYLLTGILLLLFNFYIVYEHIKINYKIKVLVCGICTFIGGVVTVFSYNMSFYFFVYFLALSLVSGTICNLLNNGFKVLSLQKDINNIKLNEIVGFSVLMSSILLGILKIDFEYINLFVYIVLVIAFVLSSSSLKSNVLSFGFIACIIPYMTGKLGINEFVIILFIISTCLFVEENKKMIVAFIAPVIIIAYLYIDNSFFVQKNILAILFALLTYLVIPQGLYEKMQMKYGRVENNFYPYSEKLAEYSSSVLNKYSSAFNRLGTALKETNINKDLISEEDYKKISSNVIEKVCIDCKSYNTCFIETKYTTENSISKIIKAIETNDDELFNSQVYNFSKLCHKQEEFIKILGVYYEFLRVEIEWRNKFFEVKRLVSDQFYDVSKVFVSAKNFISTQITFFPKFEKKILNSLNVQNIYPNKVIVLEKEGIVRVFITVDVNINEASAFKVISSVCSEVISKDIRVLSTLSLDTGNYEVTLEEVKTFDINFGVSVKKKKEVSGDSYSAKIINGKGVIAISDGMGSGTVASQYSEMTLNLFEDFLESGFDIDTTIKFINSSIILKDTKDIFSSIDGVIIDMYSGGAQFVKMGAVKSFIIRNGEVISINSKSLPVGIIKELEPKIYKKQLKQEDFVILISDGVLDVHKQYDEQEKWIKACLKNFQGRHPKDLSDFILSEALSVSNGKVRDDMTVVVCKVIKNR